MSTEENKALVRRFHERWHGGKVAALAVMDEICASDYIIHAGIGPDIRGLKDNKQDTTDVFTAFPNIHVTIDDMVSEGDNVATRWTLTGTQQGEFMGGPPKNKKVTIWGISIDRIANGKIAESWIRYDSLGMMQQLGLIPTPKTEP